MFCSSREPPPVLLSKARLDALSGRTEQNTLMTINYQQNGPDGKMEAEEILSQEKVQVSLDASGEIGYAAAMEETECKLCDGTRENSNGKPCQECSSHYDVFGDD